MQWFAEQNPIFQAFLATLFTWGVTAMGAALVFLAKDFSKKMLDVMLGFAGGVMMAASYWSLLAPAIEMSGDLGTWSFVPAAVGFVLGAAFLRLVDVFLPHLHLNAPMSEVEGVKTSWQRSTLLVTAITLHNIPEGLAVGVAFGAVAAGLDSASLAGAVSLAIGIGIQNFPEGTAVSVPLRREGMSRMKAFLYGQASGMVEPVAAVFGAAAVLFMRPVLPYALAFAAGAMIFVVVEEVIPESQASGNGDMATMGVVSGFTLMMALDVALG
ncbi:ZIP family metal transporter [Pseudodesulfovibrio indicus]|uniref:ZIP family metal transporter n=1 Tax=Pseudodesulfovibrio indicus TaxID=1716143 RepID=UPI0029314CC3|nr:ZIP family metal transporter [Pseudodesulfovibrio indicus]